MEKLDFNINLKSTEIFDEYGDILLTIPTNNLIGFIDLWELNGTGEFEQSYTEERDEDGFHYSPVDVEVKISKYDYLLQNPEETVYLYLKEIVA